MSKISDPSIYRKQVYAEKGDDIKIIDGFPIFTIVELNIYGACNRSCNFCPVSDPTFYTNKYEGISIELFTTIMEQLRSIDYEGTILISAFSEPFLHKDLPELVQINKRILPKTRLEINTNGDIFKKRIEKLTRLFDKGLDTVTISVYDGPAEYANFLQIRADLKLTDQQFVIRRRYYDKQEDNYGIIFSNRAGKVDVSAYQAGEVQEPLPMKRHCFYPFYQTLIDYNGDMILCPHDWGKEYIVGNIKEKTIWELWISKKYEAARKLLADKNRGFKPCNKCNVRGDLIGRPNFGQWMKRHEI